jgi:hypothetical protein
MAREATNLAGDEQLAQRIFYIHMGCNIGALAGFLVSVVGSIVYLVKRDLDWDRVAQAAIEVGVRSSAWARSSPACSGPSRPGTPTGPGIRG